MKDVILYYIILKIKHRGDKVERNTNKVKFWSWRKNNWKSIKYLKIILTYIIIALNLLNITLEIYLRQAKDDISVDVRQIVLEAASPSSLFLPCIKLSQANTYSFIHWSPPPPNVWNLLWNRIVVSYYPAFKAGFGFNSDFLRVSWDYPWNPLN